MTNNEIRNILVTALDKLNLKYHEELKGNDYLPPRYSEKEKCLDGEIRNIYTLTYFTPAIPQTEPKMFNAIIDADTKKLLFIAGSLSFRVVLHNEDGTITTEPGKLKL
jgi:hypothetical protein